MKIMKLKPPWLISHSVLKPPIKFCSCSQSQLITQKKWLQSHRFSHHPISFTTPQNPSKPHQNCPSKSSNRLRFRAFANSIPLIWIWPPETLKDCMLLLNKSRLTLLLRRPGEFTLVTFRGLWIMLSLPKLLKNMGLSKRLRYASLVDIAFQVFPLSLIIIFVLDSRTVQSSMLYCSCGQ